MVASQECSDTLPLFCFIRLVEFSIKQHCNLIKRLGAGSTSYIFLKTFSILLEETYKTEFFNQMENRHIFGGLHSFFYLHSKNRWTTFNTACIGIYYLKTTLLICVFCCNPCCLTYHYNIKWLIT